jgi:hypothetical protein
MPGSFTRAHLTTIAVVALSLVGRLGVAAADEPTRSERAVVEARRLVKVELRYVEAIDLLQTALADLDLSTPLRIEAYALLGQAFVAKGSIEKAEAAFGSLFQLSPDHELPSSVSPKIREVFERVKKRAEKGPRLVDFSVSVASHRLAFQGTLQDPSERVKSVDIYARAEGDAEFRERPMQIDERALSAVLDGDIRGRTRVDYYVIARGENGERLTQLGGPETPSSVFVEEAPAEIVPPNVARDSPPEAEKPQSIFDRWWFWTAVGGAIIAGVGVAIIVGTRAHGPSGTLDPIHVP